MTRSDAVRPSRSILENNLVMSGRNSAIRENATKLLNLHASSVSFEEVAEAAAVSSEKIIDYAHGLWRALSKSDRYRIEAAIAARNVPLYRMPGPRTRPITREILLDELSQSGVTGDAALRAARSLERLRDAGLLTSILATRAGVSKGAVSSYRVGRWRKLSKSDRAAIEDTLARMSVAGFTTKQEKEDRRRERFRQQYFDFHRRGRLCPPSKD